MTDSRNAVAHRRIRADHAQETAEDYVEAIADILAETGQCRIVDLTKRFGVAHVTAIRIVRRLEGEGLVNTEPYQPVQLTAKGRRLAKACRQRHELVQAFLTHLGVRPSIAAIDAEGIEHHLSPETLSAMRRYLDNASN